jgi:hypothetical protein
MAEMLLAEAAAALGVSVDTIRRRVKRGEFQHHTDGQGRIVVHLADVAGQMPGNAQHAAMQTAEHVLGDAAHVAEQVAEQHWAVAEQSAVQARAEGLQDALDAARSEVSFLRGELRRRDEAHTAELQRREESAEREREQHATEREALHARLHEALTALAMQRVLPSGDASPLGYEAGAPNSSAGTPSHQTGTSRPWWAFWRRSRSA